MSNKCTQNVKNIGLRVSPELHEKIRQYADAQGLSISDFIRASVKRSLNETHLDNNQMLNILHAQLQEKDLQLERAQKLLEQSDEARARSDTIIMQLTQLNRAHLQLEDMRKRRNVWQRIKAVFATESV